MILSNHVPELPALVDALGLSALVDRVFSSAATGFEKPNPRAFEIALHECGSPGEVWMIGDNPVADMDGARSVGIPGILVRSDTPNGCRNAPDLTTVPAILAEG